MMQIMKKIEIIAPNRQLNRVIATLEKHGILYYTILDITKGRGKKHGLVDYGSLIPAVNDSYLFTVCSADDKLAVLDDLVALFQEIGGLVITSDVKWFYPDMNKPAS
ncbi:MAG TPA: hypothetical protein DCM08_09295 [Microscillaceae bacterium]|jgi:nitrogen regulatory protein PII|nr:hypothetical protein [Microscillaceae bacterium]